MATAVAGAERVQMCSVTPAATVSEGTAAVGSLLSGAYPPTSDPPLVDTGVSGRDVSAGTFLSVGATTGEGCSVATSNSMSRFVL